MSERVMSAKLGRIVGMSTSRGQQILLPALSQLRIIRPHMSILEQS